MASAPSPGGVPASAVGTTPASSFASGGTASASPHARSDAFSDRLTSKVLRSLEGLNDSLASVRKIVAELGSPVGHSQAALGGQPRLVPTIPTSPVLLSWAGSEVPDALPLLGGRASAQVGSPAGAAPASPAPADHGSLASRLATPTPPTAGASPRPAVPPATPGAIPDAAALRRLLLSPSLRGVGLDPTLLNEIGAVFDASTLAQIAAHTASTQAGSRGADRAAAAAATVGSAAAAPPPPPPLLSARAATAPLASALHNAASSPSADTSTGEHVHFAKVASVAIPLAESPCSASDASASEGSLSDRDEDEDGAGGSGAEGEEQQPSGEIPQAVAAAVGLPSGLFDDDAAAASASLRAASIRSGRSSRSGGGRSVSGHSGLTPHEQDLYRDAGALPHGLSSSRRSSVYSYRSGTPPPHGSRTGASTPRSVSFRDPETDGDDDDDDGDEEDEDVEDGEASAPEGEGEEDEGEEETYSERRGAASSASPKTPALSSASSSPRAARPTVRIIKPATAGGGRSGSGPSSPRSTRSAGSTSSAGRSAKRGFAVRFVAPGEGGEEAAAAEGADAQAATGGDDEGPLNDVDPACVAKPSPPAAPPLGKPFTFARFGEAGYAPQAVEAYDDGTPADVPLQAEALTVEDFYELAAKVSERESYRRQLNELKAQRDAEVGAKPSAAADGNTIWDATPEPAVSPWRGGDAEWPCVPVIEPHGSRKHYELPLDVDPAEAETVASLGRLPRFEALNLRLIYESGRTGFEDSKELVAAPGSVIAGRYRVESVLGSAAFSTALGAVDLTDGAAVCLKVIKNTKDYVDQSLDEIKLLRYINAQGDADAMGVVRLLDYFYYREHLIIVTELLKDNLYELQRYLGELGAAPYFTLPRIQRIAKQVLRALAFVHGAGLIHCDLKPENILIASYSRADVKLIDFGSSSFITDKLTTYIQSRSYRAPEVILGLPYGPKIDVWSLGCILTELLTGRVLFPNESVQSILARIQAVCGAIPSWMVDQGAEAREYLLADGTVFERVALPAEEGGGAPPPAALVELLRPLRTDFAVRCGCDDPGFLDFVASLLVVDPHKRPTAAQALQHPWLTGLELPFEPYAMP